MSENNFKLLPVAVGGVFVIVLAVAVYFLQQNPEGPVPIQWDKTNCAECKMAISDRKFAAQLQTVEGDVFNFDDPGCLFLFISKRRELKVKAIYFWSYSRGEWLKKSDTVFIKVPHSPMGFNLGAVHRDRAPKDAISYREAYKSVVQQIKKLKKNKNQPTKR